MASPVWLPRAALAILLFCTLLLVAAHLADWQAGGHAWKQGDWLINLADGPVRRGLVGEALLRFGDATGLGPLAPLMALQALLLLVLVVACWSVFRPLIADNPLWAVLLLCPAFFPLFWAGEPDGSLRKELLAFTSLALLALSTTRPAAATLLQGLALMLAAGACFAHEVNVLLLPAILLAFVLIRHHQGHGHAATMLVALPVVLGGAAALVYALAHPDAAPAMVCQPLLARGLDPHICTGAIDWLDRGNAHGSDVYRAIFTSNGLYSFPLAYVLALLPVALFVLQHSHRRLTAALAILTALPFLPLYYVAVDWGRWLSLHIVSLIFLYAILCQTGLVRRERTLPLKPLLVLMALSLLWSPRATTGIAKGGPLATMARQIIAWSA
jgi:hypothetical protein